MGLLNFRQLAKLCMLAAMTISPLAGLSGSKYTIAKTAILPTIIGSLKVTMT